MLVGFSMFLNIYLDFILMHKKISFTQLSLFEECLQVSSESCFRAICIVNETIFFPL
jgi:hypothetical protein